MNNSQQNLIKQAEKIIETYSKKNKAPDNKKSFNFILSFMLTGVIIACILLLK